jgi:hypothetical protein
MKNGKIRHYSSKRAYKDSLKGMFAKDYQKKDLSRKIQKAKNNSSYRKNKSMKRISHKVVTQANQERFNFWLNKNEQLKKTKQGSKLITMQDKILKHGGDVVFPMEEKDVDELLEKGKLYPFNVEFYKHPDCERGECHTNAGIIYFEEGYPIATGYALLEDEDGLMVWRQHSWNIKETNGGFAIVDSTWKEKGLKYWGIIDEKQMEEINKILDE